jgi:hypothetical protein
MVVYIYILAEMNYLTRWLGVVYARPLSSLLCKSKTAAAASNLFRFPLFHSLSSLLSPFRSKCHPGLGPYKGSLRSLPPGRLRVL